MNAPEPSPHLRPVIAAALFAVAGESLERAAARTGTARVQVTLAVDQRFAQLIVEDDSAVPQWTADETLERTLRERLGLVEGWVSIERTAREGTAVVAVVPLTSA